MADSYIKVRTHMLELEVSEFALIFSLFNDLLKSECSELLILPEMGRLKDAIREQNLDHDWYHSFSLDSFLQQETDYAAFQELIAKSIRRIRNAGWEHGVSHSFYAGFEGACFAPPFHDGTNWRAVCWPFVQVAMVPLLRERVDSSWPLLKALGW